MNIFARFDENPAMTLQDIKKSKRYGRTRGRTHTRTANVKTVYPPQTKFAGGIKTKFAGGIMIMSVRFCLSYDLLNVILWPSKIVYFNEHLHLCNGHRHDVTCSRRKCYVTYGHNIIYDMALSTE